jgi:hypothetical protein
MLLDLLRQIFVLRTQRSGHRIEIDLRFRQIGRLFRNRSENLGTLISQVRELLRQVADLRLQGISLMRQISQLCICSRDKRTFELLR